MNSEPGSITPDCLQQGAVIRAVLNCNRAADPTQPEVEVLELPNIVGQGDNIWAFTRTVHGPISPLGSRGNPCGYGYSTRWGLVANISHHDGLARIYDLAGYAGWRFVAASGGELVWQPGSDERRLREAIEAGLRLRAVIQNGEGLCFALDVHLAEFHGARNVALFTEYDATPAFIHAPAFLERIAAGIATARAAAGKPQVTGLHEPQRTEFESLYFCLNTGGTIRCWDARSRGFGQAQPWKSLRLFAR